MLCPRELMIKSCLLICAVLFTGGLPAVANSSLESEIKRIKQPALTVKVRDRAAIRRGAEFFMDHCGGCHSLRYMRYSRMVKDLGLGAFDGKLDSFLVKNLIDTPAKIDELIKVSMLPGDAKQWFGAVPPDLSLTARERGAKWVYTYLKSFYADKSRPFGADNLLVPQVAMPNVLEPLAKEASQNQIDALLIDLMAFLDYVAEPVRSTRYYLGIIVLGFLSIFFLVVYQLKKIYWRQLS